MKSERDSDVLTRTQAREVAYEYVISELFEEDMDGPISLSLLEYNDGLKYIKKVITMVDEDIDGLYYSKKPTFTTPKVEKNTKDDSESDTHKDKVDLCRGSKRLLKIFTSFHKYLLEQKHEIYLDWSNITPDMFDTYRLEIYNNVNVSTPIPSRLKPPDTTPDTPKSNYIQTQAEQFRKGIKRSKDDFMVLKDRKQFKEWYPSLKATAAAQDVSEILDPTYVPNTPEEMELFNEKQKYMYLVAITILKTDRGIVYVGQHEADRDAQKVFEKVLNFYLNSRTADIDTDATLKYITSAKLGSGHWNGTSVAFISHWQEQVR